MISIYFIANNFISVFITKMQCLCNKYLFPLKPDSAHKAL